MSSALPLTLLATLAIFTAFWVLSLIRKDASVVDFYWGPGFVVIGWLALALDGADMQPLRLAIMLAVTVWGLRLGWHIFARHRGEEDARYADMRARHGAQWPLKSLAYVFLLQAVIQWSPPRRSSRRHSGLRAGRPP